MTTLEKYVWIVDTLCKSGTRGLSLKELNEKWVRDENISNGEPLPRQTFDRWKGNILMSFGVEIKCHLRDEYRYYISNLDSLRSGGLIRWLLDTYSTANILANNTALKDRILVEEVPSNRNFLTEIMRAMKGNMIMQLKHRNFLYGKAYTFQVAPYCLKMFQKRWYMLAKSMSNGQMRLYGLDRIEDVEMTDKHFTLPSDFDSKAYFSTFFGVVLDEKTPVQRIVLRAGKYHQHYLRTLPLHPSQKEIYTCDDYADFELHLRPTYDFCMELLRVGCMIEVLEPQSLRQQMFGWTKGLWDIYKNDNPDK